MKVSFATFQEIQAALRQYEVDVERTDLRESTKKTYLLHATHFVRWLRGDFEPGARIDGRGRRG